MNCLIWNTRGTGSRNFPNLIRELTSFYHIDFIAILETRCSGNKALNICQKLGFHYFEIVDADGFRGGLWCLWSSRFHSIKVVSKHSQFIHLQMEDTRGQFWWFTVVYASPSPHIRRALWRDLSMVQVRSSEPWCIAGDFNATLAVDDRNSLNGVSMPDQEFISFIQNMQLNDMGFMGPKFTWKRSNVESRIDRVLANSNWIDCFNDATVTHLPFFKSDHRPLLLRLNGFNGTRVSKGPFRFIASWILHNDFSDFVKLHWSGESSWNDNMAAFSSSCCVWNKEIFGHTSRRKHILLRRLEGISKVEARGVLPSHLLHLQKQLWLELDEVLLQDSLLWAQKARNDWHLFGDRNSKFFHQKANGRRRRNFIGALSDSNSIWIYETEEVKSLATCFFKTLFTEEMHSRDPLQCIYNFPMFSPLQAQMIGRDVCREEIKRTLFSMGALKAPGPDGINALFYQSQWEIVGPSICDYIQRIWHNPSIIAEINSTFLVLIPKVDHPEEVKDLRPIGLCNVILKLITKIIANRLKPLMQSIISPTQCSFVPGRHSSDNIIIAQEAMHSMRLKKGNKEMMAIKIDI